MLLLFLTFLGDLMWFFYWVPFWWSADMAKWQLGLHNFVIFMSFGNFVLKLIVIGTLVTVKQDELMNAAGQIKSGLGR